MKLRVIETFSSIQGEGSFVGTPMFFIRFAGCNLQAPNHTCRLWDNSIMKCDTDLSRPQTVEFDRISFGEYHVCITGGEPFLQSSEILMELVRYFTSNGRTVHFETNGTIPIPQWFFDRCYVTVSPKLNYRTDNIYRAHEIKLLINEATDPFEISAHIRQRPNVYLCPVNRAHTICNQNLRYALDLLKHFPQWRLGIQAHKYWKLK